MCLNLSLALLPLMQYSRSPFYSSIVGARYIVPLPLWFSESLPTFALPHHQKSPLARALNKYSYRNYLIELQQQRAESTLVQELPYDHFARLL